MSTIIVTTPEELKAIVNEAIAEFLPKTQIKESLPDTITLNTAIDRSSEREWISHIQGKNLSVNLCRKDATP